jgi:hypothetical protein
MGADFHHLPNPYAFSSDTSRRTPDGVSGGALPSTDSIGGSYILAVTWDRGGACPVARTVPTYCESDNPGAPHYADQTELFAGRGWAHASFCSAVVRAKTVSTTTAHRS